MDADTASRVARELADLGCKRLTLSGGEPTLCSYWPDVARVATDAGVKVNMITNGLRADRDLIRKAKDSGLVNLGVSLDGTEQQHDSIRGRGGMYQRVLQLLDDCATEHMPIGVITTIGKANMNSLEAIHDVIAPRAYVWQVQLAEAMGNQRRQSHPQIDPTDLLHIVPTLAHLIRKSKIEIRTADNIGYFGPFESVIRRSRKTPIPCWVGCYGGCRHMGIQADGTVKGCLSMQAIEAGEGNVTQTSLAEIWNRPGAFAYNRNFQLENLTGFCRTCEHVEICRGGCHSMRACEGGSENPFCYHRVATLADRKRPSSARRYLPMAIAPAAILAIAGCSMQTSSVDQGPSDAASDADVSAEAAPQPLYGISTADDAGPDADAAYPPAVDAYGVIDAPPYTGPDADAAYPPAGDANGIDAPPYSGPDADAAYPPAADAYGIIEPMDSAADAYGIIEPRDARADADAGPGKVTAYGIEIPPDASGK
jgi:radical SAM protein with 4Fe4S-binding SPASM domain